MVVLIEMTLIYHIYLINFFYILIYKKLAIKNLAGSSHLGGGLYFQENRRTRYIKLDIS